MRNSLMMNDNQKYKYLIIAAILSMLLLIAIGCRSEVELNEVEPEPVRPTSLTDQPPAYTLGVLPFVSPTRLEEMYAPVAVEFSQVLDRDVRFRTSSNYSIFRDNVTDEAYDIALVQPFHYIQIDQSAYIPLARLNEPLAAVFMVLPDSPLRQLSDLKGQTVAFPSRDAAVSILGKATLVQADFMLDQDVTLEYFESHDSCLQQVLAGEAAVCVSAAVAVDRFETSMKTQLRLLTKSTTVPHIVFIVKSQLPASDAALIKETILSWSQNEAGRQLLQNLGFRSFSFVDAQDSDYDIVRDMWQGIVEE